MTSSKKKPVVVRTGHRSGKVMGFTDVVELEARAAVERAMVEPSPVAAALEAARDISPLQLVGPTGAPVRVRDEARTFGAQYESRVASLALEELARREEQETLERQLRAALEPMRGATLSRETRAAASERIMRVLRTPRGGAERGPTFGVDLAMRDDGGVTGAVTFDAAVPVMSPEQMRELFGAGSELTAMVARANAMAAEAFPDTATGMYLDRLAEQYGLVRRPAAPPAYDLETDAALRTRILSVQRSRSVVGNEPAVAALPRGFTWEVEPGLWAWSDRHPAIGKLPRPVTLSRVSARAERQRVGPEGARREASVTADELRGRINVERWKVPEVNEDLDSPHWKLSLRLYLHQGVEWDEATAAARALLASAPRGWQEPLPLP
jgi:hypothetical protein